MRFMLRLPVCSKQFVKTSYNHVRLEFNDSIFIRNDGYI
mgnify:CR=1 FL=1